MKSIETLVADIYDLAGGRNLPAGEGVVPPISYDSWFKERSGRKDKTLHFSEIGTPCLRKLWYNLNEPESALPLDGNTRIKFLYGDMLEGLVISLAKVAGHDVTNEQERVVIHRDDGWTISGRIDCDIDGVTVDVKSTTKFGVRKFEDGLKDDPFGYASQLAGYGVAKNTENLGFLTIQKELGHIAYHPLRNVAMEKHLFRARCDSAVDAVTGKLDDLPRIVPIAQSATSKNTKLATTCSYCAYRKRCYPEARTFIYSNGPEFLVDVVTLPKVPEVSE